MDSSHILNLFTSRLTRHLSLVFTGNILAAGLGFLAVLIISRELSVSDFGLFSLARSTILIASALASLGMDIGMIKFASSYLGINKTGEAAQVLRMTLFVRFIISFILAALIFNTAELLSIRAFHYSDLTPLLKLAGFGILCVSALNFLRSSLYIYRLFQTSVVLQILVDLFKLSAVIVLIFSSGMDVWAAVAVFAFAPLIGILLGFGQLRTKFFSKGKKVQNLYRQLFSYSKWLFISNVCSITFSNVGIFMLAKMLSSEAAGIYGLAINLVYIFPIFINSLKSVLLPEVARFREMEQFENYVKNSLKISFYMGLTVIPFLFFSYKIILFCFGARYIGAVPIFNWLLVSYIIAAINITIRIALFCMNRPNVVAMVDLSKVILMIIGCYFLIPYLGPLAPALSAMVINASILGFLSAYVIQQIRKGDMTFLDEEPAEAKSLKSREMFHI